VYGELSPTGTIEDAVLLLRVPLDGSEIICTSSLVAPNLAVTARHCVSNFVEGKFRCTTQGELQSTDPNAGELGSHFDPSTIEFYDDNTPRSKPIAYGSQILSTLSETICTNDLAFVVLDRELSLPVLPMRLHGRAQIGESVTLVGYGFDTTMAQGDFLDLASQERTHKTDLVIDDVGPLSNDDVTSAPPRTVVIKGPSGCVGDSGGPLIAHETNALLAIDSLSDGSDCLGESVNNFFTHVPDFSLLISDAFAAAGHEPTPEPTPGEPSMSDAGRGGAPDEQPQAGAPGVVGADTSPAAGSSATNGSGAVPDMDAGGAPGAAMTAGAPGNEGGVGAANGGSGTDMGGSTGGSVKHAPVLHRTSGCAVTPSAALVDTPWPLVALVSVLEGILGVRRRGRRLAQLLRIRHARDRLRD
jgi:hypothetical protein